MMRDPMNIFLVLVLVCWWSFPFHSSCSFVCFVNGFSFGMRPTSTHKNFPKSWSHGLAHFTTFLSVSSPLDSEDNQSILSQRIRQLQEKETQEAQALINALSTRVEELQKSETIDRLIQSESAHCVHLPVLCFDSLLPQQILEGRSEDPTFCVFLRELGLGGWFVMTSLDPTTRKIRRHGVVVKIVAVDALKTNGTNTDRMTKIPTAVDFHMVGRARCRVMAMEGQGMKKRIGRWRRCHDPNGEEILLGWSDERFVDAAPEMILLDQDHAPDIVDQDDYKNLSSSEWNTLPVLINLEALDDLDNEDRPELQNKVKELSVLVDEWYSLASNIDTYKNLNVTATTRIRREHPALWVEPDRLLSRVAKQLGPRPTKPTAFSFWAASMINPLPALGVSPEIRGKLLEASTVERRLEILEIGLRRSIDNLRGLRPLI